LTLYRRTVLLYEVSPTDPLTFAAAALVLIAAAATASWLPARRATRINPIVALQGDQPRARLIRERAVCLIE